MYFHPRRVGWSSRTLSPEQPNVPRPDFVKAHRFVRPSSYLEPLAGRREALKPRLVLVIARFCLLSTCLYLTQQGDVASQLIPCCPFAARFPLSPLPLLPTQYVKLSDVHPAHPAPGEAQTPYNGTTTTTSIITTATTKSSAALTTTTTGWIGTTDTPHERCMENDDGT